MDKNQYGGSILAEIRPYKANKGELMFGGIVLPL